jgi:hypothetical protein
MCLIAAFLGSGDGIMALTIVFEQLHLTIAQAIALRIRQRQYTVAMSKFS